MNVQSPWIRWVLFYVMAIFPLGSQEACASALPAASAIPSLLEGANDEDKVRFALRKLTDLKPGIVETLRGHAENLQGRIPVSTDPKKRPKVPNLSGEEFNPILGDVVPAVLAVNGAIEAYGLLSATFSNNVQLKKPVPTSFDTHLMFNKAVSPDGAHVFNGFEPLPDLGEGMVDFHVGLGVATLVGKLQKLLKDLLFFKDWEADAQGLHIPSLQSAFDTHCEMLTAQLDREIAQLVTSVTTMTTAFGSIDDVCPADLRVDAPIAPTGNLDALKAALPTYQTQVKAYQTSLTAAQKWQESFTKLRAAYQRLDDERQGLLVTSESLRTANSVNPHLLDAAALRLTDISNVGDLAEIQQAITVAQGQLRTWKAQLGQAQRWRPDGAGAAADLP